MGDKQYIPPLKEKPTIHSTKYKSNPIPILQPNETLPQKPKPKPKLNSNVKLLYYKLNLKPIKLLALDNTVSEYVKTQNTNNQLINNTTLYMKIKNNKIDRISKTHKELIDETNINLLFNVDTNRDDLDFREKLVDDIVGGRLNAIDSIKNKYGVTFRLPNLCCRK